MTTDAKYNGAGHSANGVFPELVLDIGSSATRPTSATPTSPLGTLVESTLRSVLGWRPQSKDPKGFVAALNQAFTISEVEGHTEFAWTPRSYAIQADMGAVTGAQASIYSRAKAALDQSVPLLEGLFPIRADADDEDADATRALVIDEFTELVQELGQVGGPRLDRVEGLFDTLLGAKFDPAVDSPEDVGGLLGIMQARFGIERVRVNTVDEEQNLTNFLIVVDHVIALQGSWDTLRGFFDREGQDVFLGTQLVLISRALNVVVESVQELYFILDSVFLGAAERQVVRLGSLLTIAELLSWVERFASEEAPRIISEAGKDGVIALRPTVDKLLELVINARDLTRGNSGSTSTLPQGFFSERSQVGWDELRAHLTELQRLTNQVNRNAFRRQPLVSPNPTPLPTQLRIEKITDNHGPRGAAMSIRLTGSGFDQDAVIKFVGPIEVVDPVFVAGGGTLLRCDIRIAKNASAGSVDVLVESGGQTALLRSGFTVDEAEAVDQATG